MYIDVEKTSISERADMSSVWYFLQKKKLLGTQCKRRENMGFFFYFKLSLCIWLLTFCLCVWKLLKNGNLLYQSWY